MEKNIFQEKTFLHSDYAMLNIAHKFTAVQQRMWHFMLNFVADQIGKVDTHKISIARITSYLKAKNTGDIKDKIIAMCKYRFFNKNSFEDTNCYYFERIELIGDVVNYSYPEHLKNLLVNPYVLTVTKKFLEVDLRSKYSLFLYELFLYYKIFECNHTIPLKEFRDYMGLSYQQYTDVKTLHKHVVVPALYEISTKTPLSVSVKYEKSGKVVVGVQPNIKSEMFSKQDGLHVNKENMNPLLQLTAYSRYYRLPENTRNNIDKRYEKWLKEKEAFVNIQNINKETLKIQFLIKECLAPYEKADIVQDAAFGNDLSDEKKLSEKQFIEQIESMPNPIGIVSRKDKSVICSNKAMKKMFTSQYANKKVPEIINDMSHPQEHEKIQQALFKLGTFEFKFKTADGKYNNFQIIKTPIIYKNQLSILCMFKKVEEKETEEVLVPEVSLPQEQLLKNLKNSSDTANIITKDGVIIYQNKISLKTFGNCCGKNTKELINKFISPQDQKKVHPSLLRGGIYTYKIKTLDGKYRQFRNIKTPVMYDGKPAFVHILQDITDLDEQT